MPRASPTAAPAQEPGTCCWALGMVLEGQQGCMVPTVHWGGEEGVLGIHNAAQKQCGFKAMSSEALSTLEIKVLKKTDSFAHKNKLITRNTLQN